MKHQFILEPKLVKFPRGITGQTLLDERQAKIYETGAMQTIEYRFVGCPQKMGRLLKQRSMTKNSHTISDYIAITSEELKLKGE